MGKRYYRLLPFIFIGTFFLYYLTSSSNTPYNYFTLLADAFLHGRYWLTESPPWLNELIPAPTNRFYVVYPPMPAILMMPLVAIFGSNLNQTLVSIFFGSLNVVLFYMIILKFNLSFSNCLWLTALFGFGTNHWFTSSVGSSWYIAHVIAIFFLFLAILETFSKKRPFLIGIFLGAAYLSRLPTILSLPFFLIILKDIFWVDRKIQVKPLSYLLTGISIFVAFSFWYNWARFGNIFNFGYSLIPGVLQESWYSEGISSSSYIPRHLKVIFAQIPSLSSSSPFFIPSLYGMALWLTTPAFILALLAPIKKQLVIASWLAVFLVAIPNLIHGTVGFSQFGYRFALDFTPFLLLLVVMGIGPKLQWYKKILIVLSILVNSWGVLWINKFGWAGW